MVDDKLKRRRLEFYARLASPGSSLFGMRESQIATLREDFEELWPDVVTVSLADEEEAGDEDRKTLGHDPPPPTIALWRLKRLGLIVSTTLPNALVGEKQPWPPSAVANRVPVFSTLRGSEFQLEDHRNVPAYLADFDRSMSGRNPYRRCPQCHRIFVPRSNRQVYDTRDCAYQATWSRPDVVAAKAAYMRDRRAKSKKAGRSSKATRAKRRPSARR